jgi:hypothetical protein
MSLSVNNKPIQSVCCSKFNAAAVARSKGQRERSDNIDNVDYIG